MTTYAQQKCYGKVYYSTRRAAKRAARVHRKEGRYRRAYSCGLCNGHHLTHLTAAELREKREQGRQDAINRYRNREAEIADR